MGTFESNFSRVVSPELAKHIVNRLRKGETVEFPNRYPLEEVHGKFGGSWRISQRKQSLFCPLPFSVGLIIYPDPYEKTHVRRLNV